jgi:multidrug efflux pump subunit AcrA (membrane-fusion protein)
MPQFGSQDPTPVPFDATPYVGDSEGSDAQENAPETTTEESTTESSSTVDSTQSTESTAANEASSAPTTTEPIIYKGEILPRDRLVVVSETSGMVELVGIDVGDKVVAGDMLALVDSATLEAQRAQALAGLEAAQAQLDLVREEASEEDLEAARAGVTAAAAG